MATKMNAMERAKVLWRLFEGRALPKAETALLVLGGVGAVLIICFHTYSRWQGLSTRWTEEAARLLIIWATFMAVPLGLRQGRLITIDLVLNIVPDRVRGVLSLLSHVVIGIISVLLVWYGLQISASQLNSTSPGLGWPLAWFTAPVALMSALVLLHLPHVVREDWLAMTGRAAAPTVDYEVL